MRQSIASVLTLVLIATASSAHAHISLEQGGTHRSRDGDGELKEEPCGKARSTRGTQIYTYQPGETITVSLKEFISHPSYFRIAFDNDGDDGFVDPASIDPIDPNRACPAGAGDQCMGSDFYNNQTVLPNMDNLDPHLASFGAQPSYTWQVTLPDVECENCTLQVIQVMQDPPGHGPFDGVNDIYHQCIDLVLKRSVVAGAGGVGGTAGTGGAGGVAGTPMGGVGGAAPPAGSGGGLPMSGTGGVAGGVGGTAGGTAGTGVPPLPMAGGGSDDVGGCSVGRGRTSGLHAALSALWPLAALLRRRRARPKAS